MGFLFFRLSSGVTRSGSGFRIFKNVDSYRRWVIPLSVSLTGAVMAVACGHTQAPTSASAPSSQPSAPTGSGRASYVPKDGSILFIVGQDLESVQDYTSSGCCPRPAGVTTYIGLYGLLSKEQEYKGLGVDADGRLYLETTDWGGGPSNLVKAGELAKPGVLAVGLDMTNNENPGALETIPDGQYDAQIDHLSKTLGALKQPVLLRIGYEFDGQWNRGYENAEHYVAAYRYIVQRIVAAGASNVAFVWQGSSSLVDDIVDGHRENIGDWYPGDAYVDWVGLSWFLEPKLTVNVGGTPVSSIELVDEIVEFARQHKKPVMIAESTPQGFHISGRYRAEIAPLAPGVVGLSGPQGTGQKPMTGEQIWAAWYQPFFDYIAKNQDVIRAVAYINAHWDTQGLWDAPYENGFWGDSRVQADPYILEQWKAVLAGKQWRHGGGDLYEVIGMPSAQ